MSRTNRTEPRTILASSFFKAPLWPIFILPIFARAQRPSVRGKYHRRSSKFPLFVFLNVFSALFVPAPILPPPLPAQEISVRKKETDSVQQQCPAIPPKRKKRTLECFECVRARFRCECCKEKVKIRFFPPSLLCLSGY